VAVAMGKSYRIQLVCRHMDHAQWVVVENVDLSLTDMFNTPRNFLCPVHGKQREKPLQAEEKREWKPEITSCDIAGCAADAIGVLEHRPFCQRHLIDTCQIQLEKYERARKEQRWRDVSLESVSRFIYDSMREALLMEQRLQGLDDVQRARLLKIIFSAAELGSRVRRSPRRALKIPVSLVSEEPQNKWQEETETVVVSRCGALVRSQHSSEVNHQIQVFQQSDRRESPARVVWNPPSKGDTPSVFAFEFLHCDNFWGLDWSETPNQARP
jgi:hypothetical protein